MAEAPTRMCALYTAKGRPCSRRATYVIEYPMVGGRPGDRKDACTQHAESEIWYSSASTHGRISETET